MKFNNIFLIFAYMITSIYCEEILNSTPFITSKDTQFGPSIEGASVTKLGEAFATDFGNSTTKIGKISPNQELFTASPIATTSFNGIRFLRLSQKEIELGIKNIALVANKDGDVTKVTEMNDGTTKQEIFCKDDSFVIPNDLTLSETGRIYISGQDFTNNTIIGDGGLWICQPDGRATQLNKFGRTNGIELSPDEKTLYLSEAFNINFVPVSNVIWKFKVDHKTGMVSSQELFVDFEKLDGTQSVDVDGMRTDIKGNLYVTRNGGQEVVVFSPDKKVLSRIKLNIKHPANLEFAGDKGKTMFIVGKCIDDETKGCADTFENNIPGKAFTLLNR
jgi:gluconolactonase